MKTRILPAASELVTIAAGQVSKEQIKLTSPPWIPISGLFFALVFLVLMQFWLFNRTKRQFNIGFLTATFLMLIAFIWVVSTSALVWADGTKGYREATYPNSLLTTARVSAQQAHSSQTLALIRRDTISSVDYDFTKAKSDIQAALKIYSDSPLSDSATTEVVLAQAERSLTEWDKTHTQLSNSLIVGDFITASNTTLRESSRYFNRIDVSLDQLIEHSRNAIRTSITDSLSAVRMVTDLVMVLGIISTISLLLGIRARIQEYL